MTELNFKFFEFKFSTKFIFIIHRIRIWNSGSESGFGRGSCPMRIRIHNTAQICGTVIFPSLASDTIFFSFLTFRFLLQLRNQPILFKIFQKYKYYTTKAIELKEKGEFILFLKS